MMIYQMIQMLRSPLHPGHILCWNTMCSKQLHKIGTLGNDSWIWGLGAGYLEGRPGMQDMQEGRKFLGHSGQVS